MWLALWLSGSHARPQVLAVFKCTTPWDRLGYQKYRRLILAFSTYVSKTVGQGATFGSFLRNLYMGFRFFTVNFFTLKLKLQLFLEGHIVAMVTYSVTEIITNLCYL